MDRRTDPELQLLIKPTSSDCNASCRYCFYCGVSKMYPGGGPHRMAADTLDALVRRYMKLGLRQSVFCWQGGEPTLMGVNFYQHAVRLMEAYGADGQSVANAFQTNGLLLDAVWCDFLARYHFLVGLSLDGPEELHDAYRRSGGHGTYSGVVRAMRLLREHGVEFNVLAVVTDRTARHAARIYTHFRELGVQHMQFIPCVEVGDSGQLEPFSVHPEAYGEFMCELFDRWLPEAHAGVSVRFFDALIRREITGTSGLCELDGACGRYLVVEHNGDVYPCDFFVNDEGRLGNIRTMSPERLIARKAARDLRRMRGSLPSDCADCLWRDLCCGGCLKDRKPNGPHLNKRTYLCDAYRCFFTHAVGPIRTLAHEFRRGYYPPL